MKYEAQPSKPSQRRNRDRQNAARDVVERARSGDQVAMGILAVVRDNAKAGQETARQSLRAIEKYIRAHPPIAIGRKRMSADRPDAATALWQDRRVETILKALPLVEFWPGAVALSHGPRLDDQRLEALNAELNDETQTVFQGGVNHWRSRAPAGVDGKAWHAGRIIGLARCLQRVRLPQVPIAILFPITAWELGE